MSAASTARVRALYERLAPGDVERLDEFYADYAYFRDPFNEVHSLADIRQIFRHMFDSLEDVRFVFRDEIVDERGACLTWDMSFRVRRWRGGGALTVHGASLLRFGPDARVRWHRDYWDTCEELYAKLPGIGAAIRWLRRRLAAGTPPRV